MLYKRIAIVTKIYVNFYKMYKNTTFTSTLNQALNTTQNKTIMVSNRNITFYNMENNIWFYSKICKEEKVDSRFVQKPLTWCVALGIMLMAILLEKLRFIKILRRDAHQGN